MPPKVSVVIPVYNVAPFLRECLDSVLNQSLRDIEVICGDGGSTDGSLEILREYARRDSRIQIIHKQGSGYGQSVNDCMHMARGEYIGIVESDDAIKPQMYETLYQIAKRDALDWIRSDIYLYWRAKNGTSILRPEKIIIGNFYGKIMNPQDDRRPYRCRLRTWSGIYRRDFLVHNHIRHSETPGSSFQDIGFYLQTLYFAQRVEFIHKNLYLWRQNNPCASSHNNSSIYMKKVVDEWNLQWAYLENHPDLKKRVLPGFRYRQFLSFLWTIDQIQGNDKDQMRSLAQSLFITAQKNGEWDSHFFSHSEFQQYSIFLKTGRTQSKVKEIWKRIKCGTLKRMGF